MTPEQLRASILQYAAEGKLVKQNPNDEPASELIRKIEKEKNKLIKEGKIKKNKKLLAITDDEKQFDIPNGWEWVKLGNIVDYVQRGKSPKYDKESTRYPIISQKCVQWDGIHLEFAKHLKEDFWEGLPSYRFVTKGDLLLNSTGTGTVGRVIKITEPFNKVPVDSHVTVIRLNQNICNSYILYFLMSPIIQKNLDDYLTGTTKQKEFGLASIQNIVVSLPPLEEQKRIVAKIEKLMPLVDEYAESYNRLQKIDNEFEDKLKQSVLQYAMEGKLVKQNPSDEPASELIKKIENEKNELVKEGKISKLRKASPISDEEKAFRIPNNWKWVRLEEIAQLNTGTTPSIGKSRYEGNYIPFIKPGDISSKGINYNNFGLSKDGLKHGRLIDENSLLTVCIGGSTGKTYYTDRAISCNQQINASTPYKGVSVMFLFYEMLSNHFQEEIHQHASGSATPIINKTKFGNLCLPLPPLEEQKRIVIKIEKFMNSMSNLSK